MSFYIHTEADLDTALAGLVATDPRWQHALASAGRPPLRRRPDGFAGLAAIVVSQQVSTASAKAIWGRLEAALNPLDHQALRQARTAKLKRAGLSAPKIRTLKAIARAIHRGALDLAGLPALPADEAHRALTAIHGIGPWTADIYLLSCLGHADAWPAGDLALQEAARLLFALQARPSSRDMGPLAEAWRPWRGAAARLLWTYYGVAKQREGVAILPTKTRPTKTLPTKTLPGARARTKSARSA
jgi:DNA-3-methyladenine glycosylase II